jgi:dihydroorotase-like cyclic amidohydrolase
LTKPHDLVIENGTVWSPTSSYRADIAIDGGKIVGIGGPFPATTKRIDARGQEVMPGIWHVHCHFREPGHTYKGDFQIGSAAAAAAGGVTFTIDMTNNTPHPTSLEHFEEKKTLVAPKAHVDYALYGGGLYPRTVEAGLAVSSANERLIVHTQATFQTRSQSSSYSL